MMCVYVDERHLLFFGYNLTIGEILGIGYEVDNARLTNHVFRIFELVEGECRNKCTMECQKSAVSKHEQCRLVLKKKKQIKKISISERRSSTTTLKSHGSTAESPTIRTSNCHTY